MTDLAEAAPSPRVAPVMTATNVEAGLAAVLLAVQDLLAGPEPDADRLQALRSSYEAYRQIQADYAAQPGTETDRLVERFAVAVKAKLTRAEAKYGWQNAWAKADWELECRAHLGRHVLKGDPVDVAAYAAFCWHHGWETRPHIPDLERSGPWTLARAFELGFVWRGSVNEHMLNRGWSRDVGRTLTNPIFAGLPLNLDVIPNDQAAIDGVVLAKHEIVRALEGLDPNTPTNGAQR